MSLVLTGGTLIDGTGADPRALGSLVIEGDRFVEGAPPRDATTIDAAGLTVLPGLIDAHTHLGLIRTQDPGRMSLAMTAAQIFRNCELTLDAGFTTARDCGGVDGGLREAIEAGAVRGPRLFPSGPVLCQTGGHGDLAPPYLDHGHYHGGWPGLTSMSLVCDGPEEVRAAAREAFRYGATQIKVIISGGVVSLTDSLEDAQLTVAEIRAAVEEAAARETYVTAHAHSLAGIRNGLEAGVLSFEHGSFLDAPTAEAMARAGAFLVPTLAVLHILRDRWDEWGIPSEALPRVDRTLDGMRNAVKLARDAGVRIASGSDLLGPEQRERGLEIALKAQIMGAMEAIVSATATSAALLRIDDRLGTIAQGKVADLIAVDGDPLAEPMLFADPDRVVLVVRDGVVVKDRR